MDLTKTKSVAEMTPEQAEVLARASAVSTAPAQVKPPEEAQPQAPTVGEKTESTRANAEEKPTMSLVVQRETRAEKLLNCPVCGHANPIHTALCKMCSNYLDEGEG